VLAAAMMAIVLTATEGSIVATAMPTIVADLGGFDLFSWAFAVFLLTQAVSIPIYGRLADQYGRKPVFFAGASLFLAASLLCGLAWGMASLIFFRALQGAGPAPSSRSPPRLSAISIPRPNERASKAICRASLAWRLSADRRSAPFSSSMRVGPLSSGSTSRLAR
jgi:MFS family permease